MNEYKITYTVGGQTYTTQRIERTEASVRKAFLKAHKESEIPVEITDIEFICDNACATKQQERDTLEAIKKMVAELGPQSYLGTAFDGCFEDAEDNIDDDAAYSYKGRYEHVRQQLDEARQKIEELKEQLAESQKDYEAAHAAAHAIAEEKDAEIASLRERVLSPDDLTDVIQLVTEKRLALDTEVKNAAERIVEAAAEPESAAFQNAVKDHRAAKSELDYYTALLERLIKAKGD